MEVRDPFNGLRQRLELMLNLYRFGDQRSPWEELSEEKLQNVDEALENLGFFLDKAFLAGLPWARIIHGMGTGRLRKAVRDILKEHPQVDHFEPGKEGEGGDGVTVVFFLE